MEDKYGSIKGGGLILSCCPSNPDQKASDEEKERKNVTRKSIIQIDMTRKNLVAKIEFITHLGKDC